MSRESARCGGKEVRGQKTKGRDKNSHGSRLEESVPLFLRDTKKSWLWL